MSHLDDFLKTSHEEIENELTEYKNSFEIPLQLKEILKIYFESLSGGKKIRGALVKLGYQLAKNENRTEPEIIKVAAAFEILHTALLIHDDIIDKSPLRRGKLSVYAALGENHYGISQAICLGDLALISAIRMINQTKFEDAIKIDIIDTLTKIISQTVLGESLDVALSKSDKQQINESDILSLYRYKTAYYSFVSPLIAGALLGKADKKLLEHLKQFGENLGTAFQIQDDILGIFGDEKELGKSVTSDIEEGKNTILVIYAIKNANSKQKKFLLQNYGRGNITRKTQEEIQTVLKETGSLQYASERAEKYKQGAERCIPEITKNQKFEKILQELAEFVVERNA